MKERCPKIPLFLREVKALTESVAPQVPREQHSLLFFLVKQKMRRSLLLVGVAAFVLAVAVRAEEEVIEKGEEVVVKEDGKDNTGKKVFFKQGCADEFQSI